MIFGTKQAWGLKAVFGMLLALGQVSATQLSSDNALEATNKISLDKRGEDCEFAKWQWADVDCNYQWDGRRILNYEIKILPTGQENTQGWCKGIVDNLKGDCGKGFPVDSCTNYMTTNLHHPKTHQVKRSYGVKMNFGFTWPWTEGEDATTCVTSAIKKATCNGGITFKNGKCYKR